MLLYKVAASFLVRRWPSSPLTIESATEASGINLVCHRVVMQYDLLPCCEAAAASEHLLAARRPVSIDSSRPALIAENQPLPDAGFLGTWRWLFQEQSDV